MVVLREDDDEAVLEAAAWTLGQLGRHSAKHVEEMAAQNVLTTLSEVRPGTAAVPARRRWVSGGGSGRIIARARKCRRPPTCQPRPPAA